MTTKKKRLDDILIDKNLVKDKDEAFIVVTEGRVLVNGQKAVSPAQLVKKNVKIEIRGKNEYVGRGAYKLEEAIRKFKIDLRGKVCADIGSATGGFTQILLKYGAKRVYAIDMARGKLDLAIRNNSKVIVMEETDIRDIKLLPDKIDIFTVDVSLISLRNILPTLKNLGKKNAEIIALFKPQYEVEDKFLRHGIVRDENIRKRALQIFLKWVESDWKVKDYIKSPIRGVSGNIEYLIYLRSQGTID